MIAQARITSDTRAAVHLETETIELHGANLTEVRSRVKQVFINASRRGGEPMDVVIIESDARHHLRVEPTGRIASRTADDRPLFGPAPLTPTPTGPAAGHDGEDMADLEATVLRPASMPGTSTNAAPVPASSPAQPSPTWSGRTPSATEDPEDTDTAERAAVPDSGSAREDQAPDAFADEPTPEDDHGMADLDATVIRTSTHLSRDQHEREDVPAGQGHGSAPEEDAPAPSDTTLGEAERSEQETPSEQDGHGEKEGRPEQDEVLAGSPWAPISPGSTPSATSGGADLPARSTAMPDATARGEAESAPPSPQVAASANAWEPAHGDGPSPDLEDTRMMRVPSTTQPDDASGSGRRRATTPHASSASAAQASPAGPSPMVGSGQPAPAGAPQDRGAAAGFPPPSAPAYGAPAQQAPSSDGSPQHAHYGSPHAAPQQHPVGQQHAGPQHPGPQPVGPQPVRQQQAGTGNPTVTGGPTARPTLQDLQAATARPTTAPPTRGWQAFVHRVTGGAVSPGPGRREAVERQNTQRIRKNLDGPKNIAVVNLKGGAHKTTASLMIAATLGVARGGSVLAWDNNETRGTLGWRGARADHQHTAVDLLHNLDHLRSAHATVADLDGYVRPQGGTRFDILASDEDPGSAALIDGDSFDELNETLSRFYRLKVIDTGNNVRASNWLAAVRSADQLVIVSTVREDTFNAAAWMIDELRASGLAEQVDHAVTVLSHSSKGKVDSVLRTRLVNHFGAHTRAVTEVPYEPQFVDGSPLNWDRIAPATKDAWLNATAQMVDGL